MKSLINIVLLIALWLFSFSISFATVSPQVEEFNKLFGAIEAEKPRKIKEGEKITPQERDLLKRQWELFKIQEGKMLPKLWDIMDKLVVDLLNNQATPDDIQGIFSQLSGYWEPPPGGIPDSPNYWIRPMERYNTIHFLGVYNCSVEFLRPGRLSRLSLYTRKTSGWMKTDAFELKQSKSGGPMYMSLYILPPLGEGEALMTIEQFLWADCLKGDLKLWKLHRDGTLSLQARYDELMDYEVHAAKDGFTITYMQFPKYLAESMGGTRVHYVLAASVGSHGLQHRVKCLNPWIEVLNEYFGCIERQDFQKAKSYLKNPEILSRLKKPPSWITHEEGDISSGRALVEFKDNTSIVLQHIKGRGWVITDVSQKGNEA